MKSWLLFAGLLIAGISNANILKVVDSEDNSPLYGATLFSQSGIILGITDEKGEVRIDNPKDYPVTVRCLGYEPMGCSQGIDTARLKHTTFNLEDVVICPEERPILHLICYFREYVTGASITDTITNFNEHMGDFFIPLEKVKGFKGSKSPRFLTSQLYTRIADSKGFESVYSPEKRDETYVWDLMLSLPKEKKNVEGIMREEAWTDTVAGKYGIKGIRRNFSDRYFTTRDYLADYKDHKLSPFILKMMGLTTDFTEMQDSWMYRKNGTTNLGSVDLISGTFAMRFNGKGKWIKRALDSKTPVDMYCLYEIYPVDMEFLNIEDAKNLQNNPPTLKMEKSPYAMPLSPAIMKIIEKCQEN